MKKLILVLFCMNSFAGSEMWLRFGGGKGFSDFKNEKHEDSSMIYGGMEAAFIKDKWVYSISLDALKYEINNRLENSSHKKAKHVNENILLTFSPKYTFSKLRVGPYLGRYLYENRITLDARSQNVIGIEADYGLSDKWALNIATETNFDHGENHKVAKLGLSYKFGETKKKMIKKCLMQSKSIHLGFDKYKLSKLQEKSILGFVEGLSDISLSGHTDSIGSFEYNLALSKRRVNEVVSLLYANDSSDQIVSISAQGENYTIGTHSENRRVDIKGCR